MIALAAIAKPAKMAMRMTVSVVMRSNIGRQHDRVRTNLSGFDAYTSPGGRDQVDPYEADKWLTSITASDAAPAIAGRARARTRRKQTSTNRPHPSSIPTRDIASTGRTEDGSTSSPRHRRGGAKTTEHGGANPG
jgi:hypothetical protein